MSHPTTPAGAVHIHATHAQPPNPVPTPLSPPPPPHSPSPSESADTTLSSPSPSSTPPPPPSPSLREISSLASWTVSTYKPGCGVKELLSPSTAQFWQSDGPQPHLLTIHFFKVVSIVRMRIFLDFELDESYTPTRMIFAAGMGEYDLTEFAEWRGEAPRGWVEVPLEGCGGRAGGYRGFYANGRGSGGGRGLGSLPGDDSLMFDGEDEARGSLDFATSLEDIDEGGVLRCMCVQVRVLENHQNGKDTHVRGVQLFSRDEKMRRRRRMAGLGGPKAPGAADGEAEEAATAEGSAAQDVKGVGIGGLAEPDWMGEPEIR